jgi:hypothetical protein
LFEPIAEDVVFTVSCPNAENLSGDVGLVGPLDDGFGAFGAFQNIKLAGNFSDRLI